jgi:hypothetical protein
MHHTLNLHQFLAVLVLGALLAGCATAAQRQLQTIAANNKATLLESEECVAAIYNSPELEPLRTDLPLDPENATLAQLANENFASDAEIQIIVTNYPRLQFCRQNTVNRLARTTPGWVPIFAKMFVTNDNNLVLLVQHKLRWSEFLRRLRDASAVARSELSVENQRILAGLEAEHEAEVAQRRAALQAFAASMRAIGGAMQAYGEAVQRNRPVFTNCVRSGYQGNTVNCITH